MQDFSHVEELVRSLCAVASMQEAPAAAVAHLGPGMSLEIVIPPAHEAVSSELVTTGIVGALARGLPTGTTAVGITFAAVKSGVRVEACASWQADGRAVCVAGQTAEGVGSVGLFRSTGSDDWAEAHDQLDWLCERLRPLVSDGPIDQRESQVFTLDS
jgi:hypothetical protein